MRTIEEVEREIEALAKVCDCDCNDDDCVKCAHYPYYLAERRAELAALKGADNDRAE